MNGIPNVDCLHAGMTKKERDDAVSRLRRGESWVMVTTEVMARGMDFKGIREVINYDFPTSVQSYVHRIGTFLSLPPSNLALNIYRSHGTCWAGGKGGDVFYR